MAVGLEEARRLRQGQSLICPGDDYRDGELVRVLRDAELEAVARIRHLAAQALLAPERVFADRAVGP